MTMVSEQVGTLDRPRLKYLLSQIQYCHLSWRTGLIGRGPDAGKNGKQKEKREAEGEMIK